MNSQATSDQGPVTPPASGWVRFLRSYGPTPHNVNLFDEHITHELHKAKVQPITLSSPELEKIKQRVESGVPGSILIAGTAGDGKTYHCRGLWLALGGSPAVWADNDLLVKEMVLRDGRSAIFVKDLSEIEVDQCNSVLDRLEKSVLGGDDSTVVVMAANHGQMLERLRDLGAAQKRVHPLRRPLQDAFLQFGEAPPRLALFDLSRTTHRATLEEVVSVVAGHPEWNKCSGCALNAEGRVCPINENRVRLLGQADDGRFVSRLGDLVEVARLNEFHLPVRDMLALVANLILGHSNGREGLLGCADVAKIQESDAVENGNLYGNVFGANLPRRRAMEQPIFRALSSFGIGTETSNGADGLLIYGNDDPRLTETFIRLIKQDSIYGATPRYMSSLLRYLDGEEEARIENGAKEFLERLQSQRRRLFFTLPANEPNYPYWRMTAFRFAGDYLEMTQSLKDKKAINETTRSRLVRGLNRVMTGLLIENTDKIFVASSGGLTQSRISVLCDTEATARKIGGVGMSMKFDPLSQSALIDIALAQGIGSSVPFQLSPVRFEFLCRVAEGALPGSFSNECLEDMLAFKAKLLRQAELIRRVQNETSDEEEAGEQDGAMTLKFIEIEQNGHGFSRPVTLRIGA